MTKIKLSTGRSVNVTGCPPVEYAGPPRAPLTERQNEVLRFVEAEVGRRGVAPSIREIGDALGIKSSNGVSDHLKAITTKGYLHRNEGEARGLVLVDPPCDPVLDDLSTSERLELAQRVATMWAQWAQVAIDADVKDKGMQFFGFPSVTGNPATGNMNGGAGGGSAGVFDLASVANRLPTGTLVLCGAGEVAGYDIDAHRNAAAVAQERVDSTTR